MLLGTFLSFEIIFQSVSKSSLKLSQELPGSGIIFKIYAR